MRNMTLASIAFVLIFFSSENGRAKHLDFYILNSMESDKASHANFGTVEDIDGNTYKTVKIGEIEWMAENLKSTRYCNGDTILFASRSDPYMYQDEQKRPWQELTVSAWSYYGGNASSRDIHESRAEINKYFGKLYNWYAAIDQRNICPCGWRVPYEEDWNELIQNLGANSLPGDAVKSNHDGFWKFTDSQETGLSGFEALPGGERQHVGGYSDFGVRGYWWAQNEALSKSGKSDAVRASIHFDGKSRPQFSVWFGAKNSGYSIRCIKMNDGWDERYTKSIDIRTYYNVSPGKGVSDAAGNHYNTIKMNRQEWFTENLRTHIYNNGDLIPELSDSSFWVDTEIGGLCSYLNDRSFDEKYGKLYNGHVVLDERGVCPDGWRIPDRRDWERLFANVGGKLTGGDVLKHPEIGFVNYYAGSRDWEATFKNQNIFTTFWDAKYNWRSIADGSSGSRPYIVTFWNVESVTHQSILGFLYPTEYGGRIQHTGVNINQGYCIRCMRDLD